MSLGHTAHVLRTHLFIGKLFGNKRVTSWFTHGRGTVRSGLEFSRGQFGLLPTTLLLTSVLASVLFCFSRLFLAMHILQVERRCSLIYNWNSLITGTVFSL